MNIFHSSFGKKETTFVLKHDEVGTFSAFFEHALFTEQKKLLTKVCDVDDFPEFKEKLGTFFITFTSDYLWLARVIVKQMIAIHNKMGTKADSLEVFLLASSSFTQSHRLQ